MNTKTVYLMRHGETLFNTRHILQGAVDSPLTETGKEQALCARDNYFKKNGITFDHAYTSTQERASDTLELVTDMPYKRLKALKEMNFGKLDGEAEYLVPSPDAFSWFFKTIGGESYDDAADRAAAALSEILDQDGHDSVLAVTHGCLMHAFARRYHHRGEALLPEHFRHGCVLAFTYDPQDKTFTYLDCYNADLPE